MSPTNIDYFRIVLVGASASNLVFLKKWAKKSLAGVELILINSSAEVYYTGALSSYLNGSLTKEAIKIDLFAFCQMLGIEFIEDQAVRLDIAKKKLFLKRSVPLSYDLIFVGLGGKIAEKEALSAFAGLIQPYPSGNLVAFWENLQAAFHASSGQGNTPTIKWQSLTEDAPKGRASIEANQKNGLGQTLVEQVNKNLSDPEAQPAAVSEKQDLAARSLANLARPTTASESEQEFDQPTTTGALSQAGGSTKTQNQAENLAFSKASLEQNLHLPPAALAHHSDKPTPSIDLAVYGGSIVSFELILNLAQGLERKRIKPFRLFLINPYPTLLPYGKKSSRIALEKLKAHPIVYLQQKIVASSKDQVVLEDGQRLRLDYLIDCYQFQAESLAGLDLQADFYATDRFQRSLADPSVFITSTSSHYYPWQRKEPASGVQSVRKGENLYQNLMHLSQNKPLRPYKGNFSPLSILNLADGQGWLIKRAWQLRLGLMLKLKNWIDSRYLASFRPESKMFRNREAKMGAEAYRMATNPYLLGLKSKKEQPDEHHGSSSNIYNFCQGCASKVSGLSLQQALPDQIKAAGDFEDAAFFDFHGQKAATSLDFFPAYLKSPEAMAEVAFHHSVNDLVAKNAQPEFFQSLVVLPYAKKRWHGEMLERAFAGFQKAATSYRAKLIGGHSSTGHQLMLGVDFLGSCLRPLLKKHAAAGDLVFLTKPLGSGVVLRALMLGQTNFTEYQPVFASQTTSHQPLFAIWEQYEVMAATDISGFGLLGHLGTLLQAQALDAVLQLKNFRFFAGALRLSRAGIRTSLYLDNRSFALSLAEVSYQQQTLAHDTEFSNIQPHEAAKIALLFEAETSGPILFLVKPEHRSALEKLSLQLSLPLQLVGSLKKQRGVKPAVLLED